MAPKTSFWPLFLLSSLSSALNLAIPLVLVRVLSPAEVGSFKLFFLYLAIAPSVFLAPGLMSGLAYWAGQTDARQGALQSSAALLVVLALCSGALIGFLAGPLAAWLEWPVTHVQLFALALAAAIGCLYFEEAAIACGRVWSGALFFGGFEMVRACSIIAAAVWSADITTVLCAHTAVMLIKVIAGIVCGVKLRLIGFEITHEHVRGVLRYAWPVSLAGIFAVLVNYADQLLLSAFITPAEFALYSIGCLSLPPLFLLEQSVTRVLVPQLAGAFAGGDSRRAAALYRAAVLELSFFMIPAVLMLTVFSDVIVTILFTSQYRAAGDYLRYFAVSYLFLALPFDVIPRARGEARWILRAYVISSAGLLVMTFLLIRAFGAWGALHSLLLSRFLMRTYGVYYAIKTNRFLLADLVPLRALGQLLLRAGAIFSLAALLQSWFQSSIWWLVCAGGSAALLYVLTCASIRRQEGVSERRVLLITQHLTLGGLESMVETLAIELKQGARWFPIVFSYDHNEPKSTSRRESLSLVTRLRESGIETLTYKKPPGFSIAVVLRMFLVVMRRRISVLHTHNLGSLMYGGIVKLVSLGTVRIVHTQHSFVHLADKRRYAAYERIFSRLADSIVCVSESMLETYRQLGVRNEKLSVIPNGIRVNVGQHSSQDSLQAVHADFIERQPAALRAELAHFMHKHWVLYLARVHPLKGQAQALKLWSCIAPELRKSAALIFVGPESEPGEFERLKELAQKLNLSQEGQGASILFAGATDAAHEWMQASQLFLSCSHFEGMPLSPLEAYAAGLPLVLSDIPGHALFCGRAVFIGTADLGAAAASFSEALKQIMQKPHQSSELRQEAQKWVEEHFGAAKMAKSYERLYDY